MTSITKSALTFAMLAAAWPCSGGTFVHETKYDWSGLASSITSASRPDYEKAHDIYTWLTHNIAYDTSYSIRSADETYEQHRGVCQGYCELFYRIAEAVGLRCDIITGKSKDTNGNISDKGHAWMFVYTNGNSGILVDPTWGAGSVNDGKFTSTPSDDWFHVSPEWLIFSHFPDEEKYQLLSAPISFNTFGRIGYYEPSLSAYGYDGKEFLASELAGNAPAIPSFSRRAIRSKTSSINVPLQKELRVGTSYKFCVTPTGNDTFVIVNGNDYESNWGRSGNQAYIRFIPSSAGTLVVGVETEQHRYMHLVQYTVAQPTAQDIANLERECPLRSPAITSLKNYRRKSLETWGIEPRRLLATVKSERISALPQFYDKPGCRAVDVPLNGVLNTGKTYTFRFTPGHGNDFAAINGETWTREWTIG